MRPQYKFIVINFWGHSDISELNENIQDESNELLTLYEDVDIQSMVKIGDRGATVIYKVKLQEIDELVDWGE